MATDNPILPLAVFLRQCKTVNRTRVLPHVNAAARPFLREGLGQETFEKL